MRHMTTQAQAEIMFLYVKYSKDPVKSVVKQVRCQGNVSQCEVQISTVIVEIHLII